MRDQIKAEYDRADPGDRDELQSRLTAAEARLADPDAAFAKAQSRIADLEGILKRDRNHLLADRVSDAQDKLKLGDFSAVDLLVSQIVAGGEPAVQSVARAAFGRGEIAEQELRWHDALGHFEQPRGWRTTMITLPGWSGCWGCLVGPPRLCRWRNVCQS